MVRFIPCQSKAGNVVVQMTRELERLLNGRLHHLTSINQITLKWLTKDGGGEYFGKKFEKRLSS